MPEDTAPKVTALKLAIVRSGRTADSLARDIGVTPAALSRWTKGHRTPTVDYALALSRELQVPVEELFTSYEKAAA